MLLGFKKRFKEPILIGTKVHTIRKRRKIQPNIGETIHMYSGLRTKYSEFICNNEKLLGKQNIRIIIYKNDNDTIVKIWVDRSELNMKQKEQLALFDGFTSLMDFADYWLTDEKGKKKNRTGALMQLFHWTDLKY